MSANEKVSITNKVVIFGGQFWSKLDQSPCTIDKHGYWIHKLGRKIDSTMKKVRPTFTAFTEELGEKYGKKDTAGKVIVGQNGLPQADAAQQDAYGDMLEEFMQRTNVVDFDKLPLDFFSHINKTPMDWEALEQIAIVSPAILDKSTDDKDEVQNALRSLQGGHV